MRTPPPPPQRQRVKSYLPCSYYLYFFHVDGAGAQIPRGVSSTEREIEGHKEPSTTKCSYLPGHYEIVNKFAD